MWGIWPFKQISLKWHIYYNSSCECNVEPEKKENPLQMVYIQESSKYTKNSNTV